MICLGLASLSVRAGALPQSDPAQAEPLVTQVCAACHGADGNSINPTVPSLAGQGAHYIYEQLTVFKAQLRNGVMSAIAVNLTAADMRNVAAYFAQQIPRPVLRSAIDSNLVAQGERIYRDGILAKGVPACASCHALNATGLAAEFPQLAGQHALYLIEQLRAFRSGNPASNSNAMMRALAVNLTDREIDAVAQYLAVMNKPRNFAYFGAQVVIGLGNRNSPPNSGNHEAKTELAAIIPALFGRESSRRTSWLLQ